MAVNILVCLGPPARQYYTCWFIGRECVHAHEAWGGLNEGVNLGAPRGKGNALELQSEGLYAELDNPRRNAFV